MSHMSPLPPIETRSLQVAKKCKIYRNGDPFFSGKTVTVDNRKIRTFDAFLSGLTNDLKLRNGAVRKLVTPTHGHRVKDLSELEDGKFYVAAGAEPFNKAIVYTQIESYSPRRRHRQAREERLIPAHHNKYLENITGKIGQIPTQGKAIDVVINGHFTSPSIKVCLLPHQQYSMREVRKVVAEKVAEEYLYRCDMLVDLEGNVITDVKQIESGGLYVAKKNHHHFQPGRYDPHGRKNIIIPLSPREKPPKYLWKERTLPPIHQQKKHSPDHSVSSYPETRKRNQVNGVPVKAAKHTKRTPKQADYDKDDGGVFKAKGQNRDTKGAREVRDTGDTKVDLPIDQVRAEEVKDERIKKEKQSKDTNSRPTKQADHSHGNKAQGRASEESSKTSVNTQSKTVQNGKNSTYKSNSKAPPPDQNRSKNDFKNDSRKDDKTYNNHDPVRSSTPKDISQTSSRTNDASETSSPTKSYSNSSEENKVESSFCCKPKRS